MGPSGNGLVERMKAGESPWDQGRSNGRPCPFPEGGPEDEGKRRGEAPIGAPVRVMGRLFPSAGGTGFAVRLSHRVRRSAPAPVGASPPLEGGKSPKATGRTLPRNDGAWLVYQSDNDLRKRQRAFWQNEPRGLRAALFRAKA